MRSISKFLREVEEYARMEFPKVGEPLRGMSVVTKKSDKVFTTSELYQPHIIGSESIGAFLDVGYKTPEEAIIAANEEVIRLKKLILGRSIF